MKIELLKIIKITAGKFHCWCESNVDRVRKPNSAVPERLWAMFEGRPYKEPTPVIKKEVEVKKAEPVKILKWRQKLLYFLIKLFRIIRLKIRP